MKKASRADLIKARLDAAAKHKTILSWPNDCQQF